MQDGIEPPDPLDAEPKIRIGHEVMQPRRPTAVDQQLGKREWSPSARPPT